MLDLVRFVVGLIADLLRPRARLVAENVLLHRWRDRVVPRPPARAPAREGKPPALGLAETRAAGKPPPRKRSF